ncbi:tether containing UBX domain for GLUT4 [Cynoglossus semilaevis]|uniref:ASPSCR1 tether for SLC2A4, UBX domain containing n=1 Tax=Cynoglossus semilaevis TaxID=244447 RepID=A0A3P8WG71_CYNSE|nr:tether containing UBX domain for GLUT4 [Cynoglossus semilaevis]
MATSCRVVTVLVPNGRRQEVKVFPSTSLLQVLEDVCRKHGFNPDDHGLKFQGTFIDLTLPLRYSNLPNNAKLEMVTSTWKQSPADSQVRIAVQMEDGSRLQDSFSCQQNLWELLTHFSQISLSDLTESGSTPVCVYMRDEVSGQEALKKTTLKALGLTSGSAIVRFLLKKNKSPGEKTEATVTVSKPSNVFAKESAHNSSSKPDTSPSQPETSSLNVPGTDSEETLSLSTPTSATGTPLPVQQRDVLNPQKICSHGEEDGEAAGPSGLSPHSSSSSPKAQFNPSTDDGRCPNSSSQGCLSSFSSPSLTTLSSAFESPKAKKAKSSQSSSLQPVQRDPLIYHLDSVPHRSKDQWDPPEEFFEVTVDDVRKRFAQLKSERKKLEEAPLMTKSLRESQKKKKLDKYPKVVLRVQFPDRYVLQGYFGPLETVGSVSHFVKSHLENPQLNFYLFTTPPKTIVDNPSATLFQADLFPNVLMYFGSEDKTDSYIKRELLDSSVPPLRAKACFSSGSDDTPLPSVQTSDTRESTLEQRATSSHIKAAKTARCDAEKLPKWFKPPGKK